MGVIASDLMSDYKQKICKEWNYCTCAVISSFYLKYGNLVQKEPLIMLFEVDTGTEILAT